MRYRAECKECGKESMDTLNYGYAQYWSEQHAMSIGHTQIEIITLL